MPAKGKLIAWLEEVDKNDTPYVGGKAANLGELLRAGIRVPPGFVVTAEAYKKFMEETGLFEKIINMIKSIDVNNTEQLEETSRKIKQLILDTPMPRDLEEMIKKYYVELGKRIGVENPLVAVRSSATAEDLP